MQVDPKTRARAKALRRELTDAERLLWSQLKGRKLAGRQFRIQHPIGPFIADFACVREKLVVEIDGATHSTDEERDYDMRRTSFLAVKGWTVLRFWNSDVFGNLEGVLTAIGEVLPPPSR